MAAITKNSKTNEIVISSRTARYTVDLQWLKHPWDYENLFETGVVRAIEG